MDLTVLTPAAPKRKPRIEMIFNRLVLNARRHPDINFEYVIVDDSLDAEYRELLQNDWPFAVKYISLPLEEPYPNPSYMRNVGFRIAQGEVFTMIDADHWIHEDFIEGALEPYKDRPAGMSGIPPSILNTGFMIDTSKGTTFTPAINDYLLQQSKNLSFTDCMKISGINGPIACNRVWLVAYPGRAFLDINGYDEHYVTGYSREDDDIYFRLRSYLMHVHTLSFKTFAGVHLWHPQGARNQAMNELNKKYYNEVAPANRTRNYEHEWGKFVEGSYSVIDGIKRNFFEHEEWIINNTLYVDTYKRSVPWKDFKELRSQFI